MDVHLLTQPQAKTFMSQKRNHQCDTSSNRTALTITTHRNQLSLNIS
jgi:hypothetical protein